MTRLKHNYYLENKNIRIRPLNRDDIETLRKWRNDEANTKFLSQIPYITEEMQIKWYENYLMKENEIVFAIDETMQFKRLVGSLSLYDIKDDECYFGKILIGDAETRGCGIGTNATEAVIQIAIEQLRKSRVLLFVYKDNKVAYNLYTNIGFKIIDEHCVDGDMIEYTMEYKK